MQSWPAKDPDEILDYDVDWSVRLMSASELEAYQAQVDAGVPVTVLSVDTIASSQFILPSGIVAQSSSFAARATKVWLTGGTLDVSYEILNRITTAGGRTMDQTVKIRVKAK